MSLPVRLIATDIDGTLLGRDYMIPRENIDAIRQAQSAGITVAIASGRFPENVYLMLQDAGLSCPIIGLNGGNIADERLRPLRQRFMSPGVGEQVQALLEEAGADYFMFGDRCLCTSNPTVLHHSELADGKRIREMGFAYFHGPEAAREFARGKIFKFFVRNNVPLAPLRERLAALEGILLTQSSPQNIEVMPLGVDKGRGIRDLADGLGVPLSQVMALGDEENDIPMLAAAGYGVAMGNASPEARAAARYLTDTNVNCGFARAIRAYALQEESTGAYPTQPGHAGPDPQP